MMKKLNALLERKSNRILAALLLSLVYFSRIVFLDADLPAWGVSAYQPIDEGIYATLALNMQNYGTLSPNEVIGGQYFLITSQELFNLPLNIMTYFGMVLFGDNYFGFRIGSVVIGYINLALLVWIITTLFEHDEKMAGYRFESAFLVAILYILSFPMYIATRTVEPSLYRMTCVLLIVVCYLKLERHLKVSSFLIGFITAVSIFLVYVTNLFIGIAVIGFLVRLFVTGRRREAVTHLQYGLLGALIGYGASILYYQGWGITPLTNSLASVFAFSGASSDGFAGNYEFSGLISAIGNGLSFIASNPVLYSIPIISLFVAYAPSLSHCNSRSFADGVSTIKLMVFGLFIQTMVTEDFIVRKMIIVYPLMLVLGAAGFYLNECASVNAAGGKRSKVAPIIAVVLVAYVLWERLEHANNMVVTTVDFSEKAKLFIAFMGLLSFIPLLYLLKSKGLRRNKAIGISCLTLYALLNIGLISNYCILDRSYTEKTVMQEIGETVGDAYVAGDYSMGFTLYNDIKPVKNDRNELLKFLGRHPEAYFLDYSNAQFFTSSLIDTWQTLSTERVFYRSYQNGMTGSDRNISLYKTTYIYE